MNEVILIKLGEIVLKGLNRNVFETALLRNLKRRLEGTGKYSIVSAQSTVCITPCEGADMDAAVERVRKVFGVIAFSRACVIEKDMERIMAAAVEYLQPQLAAARTFKVESKRADKAFLPDSPGISAAVGERLLEAYPHLRVDVRRPEVTVRVEVRDFAAYVHGEAEPGAGGIPVGTGGRAAILISGGIDSPVAAWQMAKRGVELTAIHFASPPYTSERAEQKVRDLLSRVAEYAGRLYMFTVPFTHIQEEIKEKCPEEYFTLIMRRLMMRISEILAKRENCDALITGESLGQVASQTIQAIACTDRAAQMPVFRPLIGMDKAEIVALAHRIDTFDISIQPFEDCCTVFTPRHPRTRPELYAVEAAEELLDTEALIEEALEGVSVRRVQAGAGF